MISIPIWLEQQKQRWLKMHRQITAPRREGYPLTPEMQAQEYRVRRLLTFHFGVTFEQGLYGHVAVTR